MAVYIQRLIQRAIPEETGPLGPVRLPMLGRNADAALTRSYRKPSIETVGCTHA